MAKLFKYLAITLLSLILIIAIIMVGVVTFVNPNNFKNDISKQVFKATGRTLTINGDIKWSFFPWIGLEVNDATLSNALGFGKTPFAELGQAKATIKLLPLLSGHIQAGTLNVQHLTLNLMKNTQGENNWQDMANPKVTSNVKTLPTKDITATPKTKTTSSKTNKKIQLLVSNISLNNITLNWQDAQTQTHRQYAIKQLQSHNINLSGHAFPMKLIAYTKNARSNQQINILVTSDITLNLSKQNATLNHLAIQLNNLKLNGELSANHFLSNNLTYQGQVTIPSFNAATLIANTDHSLTLSNPNALKKVNAAIQFTGTNNSLNIATFTADVDSTHINGSADITNLKKLIGNFKLAINAIDLDDYKMHKKDVQTNSTQSKKSSSKPTTKTITATTPHVNSNTYNPPFGYASLNGEITANTIIMNKIKLTNVSTLLNIQQGVFAIGPIKADVYNGKLRANLVADYTRPTAKYNISETLNGVQMQPLISAIQGKSRLSGTANVNANLTANGKNNTDCLRSLTGTAGFSIQNGKIQDFQLMQAMNTAASLFFRQPANNVANQPTTFTNTAATFTIRNGVASTNDLILNSPAVKVTGKGTIDLVTQQLNMLVDVNALTNNIPEVAKLQQAIGGSIPLKVKGTLSHPQVAPDMNTITLQATKQKVGKQLKHLGDDLNKTGKDLGKQIKSFFN